MRTIKTLGCLAVAAMLALTPVLAAEVVPEGSTAAPENENVQVIAYEGLQGFIERSNTTYLVTLANIDAAEESKKQIADNITQMFNAGVYNNISSMWGSYGSTDETIKEMIKELPRTIGTQKAKAEDLFYEHYILTLKAEAARSKLETLLKDREVLQARLNLGLVSPSDAIAMDNDIASQRTAIETADKNVDKNILDIKSVLGISLETEIVLGELPALDAAGVMNRVFEDDMALYFANSKTLEDTQKDLKDAEDDFYGSGTGSKAAVDSQKLVLEQTKIEIELALKSALNGLQNGYQSMLDSRKVVDDLYQDQEKLIRSYNLGLVAASKLRAMNEGIRDAENGYQTGLLQWTQSYVAYLNSLQGYEGKKA